LLSKDAIFSTKKGVLSSPLPLPFMKLTRAIKTSFLTQTFGVGGTAPHMLPLYNSMGLEAHNGWDWLANKGEPVYWDCLDCYGRVENTHIDRDGGLGVVVDTEDKDGKFRHLFWHLESFACQAGQVLSSGDLIGYADSTGRSTGHHLHRGLKPAIEDRYGNFVNKYPDNKYAGAVDIKPYFEQNIFIKDYTDNLKAQVSVLGKIVKLLSDFIKVVHKT